MTSIIKVDQIQNATGTNTLNLSTGNSSLAGSLDLSNGGVYLGGTGSANYLDDYEEGTWTPTIKSGTANFTDAYYIKVGNLVTLSLYCDSISDQSSSTVFEISSLPFSVNPSNDDANVGQCMVRYFSFAHTISAFITSSGVMRLYKINSGATYTSAVHSDFNSSLANVRLMFNYFTN